MYRFNVFSPTHIDALRPEDVTILSPIASWESVAKVYAIYPSFSLFHGATFVCCGGVVIPWSGMGEGWLLMGAHDLRPHGRAMIKYTKLGMKIAHDHFGVKRLQTPVLASNKVFVRFAELLGLTNEGLMRNYGPDGEDYFMMSRTEWEH